MATSVTLPPRSSRDELLAAIRQVQAGAGVGLATGELVDEVLVDLRRAATAAKAIGLTLGDLEPSGTWWPGTDARRSTSTIVSVSGAGYEITRGEPSERVARGVIELRLRPVSP